MAGHSFIGLDPSIESFTTNELAATELNHRERGGVPDLAVRYVRLASAQLTCNFGEREEFAASAADETVQRLHP